jgi:hypothetical protein
MLLAAAGQGCAVARTRVAELPVCRERVEANRETLASQAAVSVLGRRSRLSASAFTATSTLEPDIEIATIYGRSVQPPARTDSRRSAAAHDNDRRPLDRDVGAGANRDLHIGQRSCGRSAPAVKRWQIGFALSR